MSLRLDDLQRLLRALDRRYELLERLVGMRVKICDESDCWAGCLSEVHPQALAVALEPVYGAAEEGEPEPRGALLFLPASSIKEVYIYGPCRG